MFKWMIFHKFLFFFLFRIFFLLTLIFPFHFFPPQGLESARLLGVFVKPEIFIKLLLAHVKNSSYCSCSSPWAPLMVLAAMLKGSNRKLLGPQLVQVGQTLAHPDVCQESQQVKKITLLTYWPRGVYRTGFIIIIIIATCSWISKGKTLCDIVLQWKVMKMEVH